MITTLHYLLITLLAVARFTSAETEGIDYVMSQNGLYKYKCPTTLSPVIYYSTKCKSTIPLTF